MPHPLFPYLVMDRTFPQPVLNLPEEGAYNIGATTDVPLQENPNVVPPEEEDVDRYLNFDMIPEVATISPAMDPSSNIVALGVNESDSNSVNNISRKRSLPESASRQIEEPKRLDTRSQVRDTRNVIPQSAGTTIPSTNMRADSMDNTNHTTGSHVQPYTSTHSLHSSFQPSHPVQPPSFHSTPFMSNPALTVNTMTAMNAPHSISSPFPHAGMDIIAPIYERGSYMFGPVVTSMGNFPTYRPNWSYVDTDRDTARRSLAFVVPHPFEPPELQAVQLLPGIVGNGGGVSIGGANTYHPLTDHASSSTWFPPQGSGGMHHFGAVISPATQNLQSLMQTSSPAIPPIFIHEPAFPLPQFPSEETRRGLPNEVFNPYNYKNLVFFLLALLFRLNLFPDLHNGSIEYMIVVKIYIYLYICNVCMVLYPYFRNMHSTYILNSYHPSYHNNLLCL